MKINLLYILLTCLILLSCSVWEETPPPTLEPAFFEAEALGTPHAGDDPSLKWVILGWDVMYMEKGLTRAGKIQLERGQISYFLLNFTTELNDTLIQDIKASDMEILWWVRSFAMVRVQPLALSYLQQLNDEGVLKFAGPVPPRVKIKKDYAEFLQKKKDFQQFEIAVTLLAEPTEEERAEITTWFDIKEEKNNKYRPLARFYKAPSKQFEEFQTSGFSLVGRIKVKHIPALLELPIVFGISQTGNRLH